MTDTKLVRTCTNSDKHTLVLQQGSGESDSFGPTVDLLPDEKPTDALAVTYQESARFLHGWYNKMNKRPRNLGVVSVGEQMRSATTASSPAHTMVQGVADQTDTETIRDSVTWYLDAWPTAGRTVTYFDSVTELVEDHGVDAATDFLRAFMRTLDAHDAVGYFCLKPDAHDREVVCEVASSFDTVVEQVANTAETTTELSVSDCFDAMADSRRRHVVAEIAANGEVPVGKIADRVATEESIDCERARASLLGVHLPKLAELGVIAYDRERRTVARSEHFERVEPLLRKALDHG